MKEIKYLLRNNQHHSRWRCEDKFSVKYLPFQHFYISECKLMGKVSWKQSDAFGTH
jgi:hypothetical protein